MLPLAFHDTLLNDTILVLMIVLNKKLLESWTLMLSAMLLLMMLVIKMMFPAKCERKCDDNVLDEGIYEWNSIE